MTHQPNDHISQAELDRLEQAGHPQPTLMDEANHIGQIPGDKVAPWPESGAEDFEVRPKKDWSAWVDTQSPQQMGRVK